MSNQKKIEALRDYLTETKDLNETERNMARGDYYSKDDPVAGLQYRVYALENALESLVDKVIEILGEEDEEST